MDKINKLPNNLKTEFLDFLNNHPPAEFSISLRHLLLDYMQTEKDFGFRFEFRKLLWSLNDLFDLLNLADTEIKNQANTHKPGSKKKRKQKK